MTVLSSKKVTMTVLWRMDYKQKQRENRSMSEDRGKGWLGKYIVKMEST